MSLCSLHGPSGSGERAGSEVSTGQAFTYEVLAVTTSVGGALGPEPAPGLSQRRSCSPRHHCPDGGGGRSWRSLTCSLEIHILLAPSNGPFGTEGSSAAMRGWSGCAGKAGVHYGMVPTCQPELQTATCQPTAATAGQQWLLSPHSDVVRAASRLHPPHLSLLPLPC